MKNFALIGAAGYIAPRHLKAIKETGNTLVAALDKSDTVGIMDAYFPDADFFTEFERFDRHIDKLKRQNIKIDYVSICTPNYLHDSHIRFALRHNADAICEKPLVLNPWNVDALAEIEKETGRQIFNILQLRLHPTIIELKRRIDNDKTDKIYDIELTYITSRGSWYYNSWKGDSSKSGGISTNIGVHFYDMLQWVFGSVKSNTVNIHTYDRASGLIDFAKARVRWFLSIDRETLPDNVKAQGKSTFRSLTIEGDELEFSDGFTDLHTLSYKAIMDNKGFGLNDVRVAIELVHEIRNAKQIGLVGDYHPFAGKKQSIHPLRRV